MRRTAVLLVVLLALLWQGVAMARPGSTVNVLADVAHAALHWHGDAHHHHDDGSYTLDDSPESGQHVMADHVANVAALMASAGPVFPPARPLPPRGLHPGPVPHPFLAGLLRPPRPHA